MRKTHLQKNYNLSLLKENWQSLSFTQTNNISFLYNPKFQSVSLYLFRPELHSSLLRLKRKISLLLEPQNWPRRDVYAIGFLRTPCFTKRTCNKQAQELGQIERKYSKPKRTWGDCIKAHPQQGLQQGEPRFDDGQRGGHQHESRAKKNFEREEQSLNQQQDWRPRPREILNLISINLILNEACSLSFNKNSKQLYSFWLQRTKKLQIVCEGH